MKLEKIPVSNRTRIRIILSMIVMAATVYFAHTLHAQSNAAGALSPPIAINMYSAYPITPIAATGGSGAATTLTIPAPTQSGFYNYVCYLAMEGGNDTTATVVTNATGSSTNFNGWANKTSTPSAASNDTGVLTYFNLSPPGCAKSQSPTTATTFVSPNSTHEQYTWYATYFQAP